jgi:glycosyltransferase involved in cell wall biosynthesis
MNIDILCGHGSPLGVTSKTIWGDGHRVGTGGSELALLTMCEEWTKAGHKVVLYNNPVEPNASPFEQRAVASFNPNDERDVIIVFRFASPSGAGAKGLRVWWCTDPPEDAKYAGSMHKIVCISPYQYELYKNAYNTNNIVMIDLPVRVSEYEQQIEKVKNRVIFSSVPARGSEVLMRMWSAICDAIPDASLMITSDYRLWGSAPSDGNFITAWKSKRNYEYAGAVSRKRLIEEQLKAQIHLYPSIYPELFCVSVAESEVAGVYPITTAEGALETTNMGEVIHEDANNPKNDKLFIDKTIELLSDQKKLKLMQEEVRLKAIERFSPGTILKQWNEKVFDNG